MLTLRQTLILMAATATLALGSAGAASAAEAAIAANYPGRAEVNHRLATQDARIRQAVHTGQMSKAKAARLHAADHAIRRQEHRMAMRDNRQGHLTAHQVNRLNREENAVSRHIGG